jgi:hypothetical protein
MLSSSKAVSSPPSLEIRVNLSRAGFASELERLYVPAIPHRTLPGSRSMDHMSISDLTWQATTFGPGVLWDCAAVSQDPSVLHGNAGSEWVPGGRSRIR